MFNDISWWTVRGNEEECVAHAEVVSIFAKKVWYRTMIVHWSRFRTEMVCYERRQSTMNLGQFRREWMSNSSVPADVQLSEGWTQKSKGHGKLSIHFAADQETIETIFRIIVSANQLSLYGAVANTCEECESLHDRSGRLDAVIGQSIVLSAIQSRSSFGEVMMQAHQIFQLQQYEERIERLSQTGKVSKFCMDAGFLSVVENRQYFWRQDTGYLT